MGLITLAPSIFIPGHGPEKWQHQPSPHDPNPPIELEDLPEPPAVESKKSLLTLGVG